MTPEEILQEEIREAVQEEAQAKQNLVDFYAKKQREEIAAEAEAESANAEKKNDQPRDVFESVKQKVLPSELLRCYADNEKTAP